MSRMPGLVVPLLPAGQHVLDPLEQLVHAGALDDRLDGHPGDEADHAELVEVLEVAGVVGEQPLGDQLEQHVVVALERGEHVGVGLERGEPVDGEVPRAAARLAALLDRAGGVPGAERLGAGGARLELAPRLSRRRRPRRRRRAAATRRPPGRSAGRRSAPAAGTAGAGASRSRAAAAPRPGRPPRTAAAARRSFDRDRQRDLGRVDARAADADPSLDEGAEHREEAAVGVLDLALVRHRPRARRRSGRAAPRAAPARRRTTAGRCRRR